MEQTPHPFLRPAARLLVLASRSPRRAAILRAQGLLFEVEPAEIDESARRGEGPSACVQRLAQEKARAVASQRPSALVLGCDTVVEVAGRILGKPSDQEEARTMLRGLSGREHRVHSAAALVCLETGFDRVVEKVTRVRFRPLEESEIVAYVATGEPMDKAGAYGIQDRGAMLVESIEGCYFNVMGLPLQALRELWNAMAAGGSSAASPKREGERP